MSLLDMLKNNLKTNSAARAGKQQTPAARPSEIALRAAAPLAVRKTVAAVEVDALPLEARAKAAERLKFVRQVMYVKATRDLSDRASCDYVAVNHVAEYPILRGSGQGGSSQLHYNSFRNWSPVVRQGGDDEAILQRLADGYARGVQAKDGDPRFWEYFFAFFLNQNKLPVTVAYKSAAAKMRKVDPGTVIPTLTQARYRVSQLDLSTIILAREGEEAYKNRCVDYITRDWTDIPAGELVIGDSRTFDTRVRVFDESTQKYRAVRPTIAALIDARSWYITAYWITTEPVNADMLIRTLALHCYNNSYQPPAVAYFDNGADYSAAGFSKPLEVDGVEHSIFRELGITLINSRAYNARAKTIERMFRSMMQQFDKMFPDYLGSRPGQRTLAADYFDTHAEELPELEQFAGIFADWLDSYHVTPQTGKRAAGRSPLDIWSSRPQRPAVSYERLRLALCKPVGLRRVDRGPAISYEKTRYYSDALKVGTKVLVKTDPFEPDRVLCYSPQGALLGEARTRDSIKAIALDDPAARQRISELQKRQYRQLKAEHTVLAELTGNRHHASPIELFLADADAELVPVGRKSSVKGAAHSFIRYTTGVIEPAATRPAAPATLDFKEDRDEAKLRAFGDAVTQPDTPAEEAPPAADLEQFNSFMTSRRRDDDF